MDEREQDLRWKPTRSDKRGKRQSSPKLRREIEQGRRALELLARGVPMSSIAADLDVTPPTVSRIVARALEQRAEREGPRVDAARALMGARLEVLLSEWLPRSLRHTDPVTGEIREGNAKAAETTLKILGLQARICGVDPTAVKALPASDPAQTNVNVHVHTGGTPTREELQAEVLAQLTNVREKQRTIDGTLADTGLTLADITGETEDDKPGPPPQRESAA